MFRIDLKHALVFMLVVFLFTACREKLSRQSTIAEQIRKFSYLKYTDSVYFQESNGTHYKEVFNRDVDSLLLVNGTVLYAKPIDHSYSSNDKGKRTFYFTTDSKFHLSFINDIDYAFIKSNPVFCTENDLKEIKNFMDSIEIFRAINTFLKLYDVKSISEIRQILSFVFGEEIIDPTTIIKPYHISTVERAIRRSGETNPSYLDKLKYYCCLERLKTPLDSEELNQAYFYPTDLFGVISCTIDSTSSENLVSFNYRYYECNFALY